MTQDLFDNRSAKQKLYEWLKQKKWAKTSEVCAWGVNNYSPDRASRNARQLAKELKIRRMPPEKQERLFGKSKEKIWEIIPYTNIPITQRGR